MAARLRLSRAKVYELMASGALRSARVDGYRRVRFEDLATFVANLDERLTRNREGMTGGQDPDFAHSHCQSPHRSIAHWFRCVLRCAGVRSE